MSANDELSEPLLDVDETIRSSLGGEENNHSSASSIDDVNGGVSHEESLLQQHGSSLGGAIFNFTNTIIGAGAIGLGGAIAESGGAISIAAIVFFAVLTKLSLDLVIRLSVETEGAHASYEDLGKIGFGWLGYLTIMASKFLYSSGCLVAYVIVVKDNLGPAIRSLIYGNAECQSWFCSFLGKDFWMTWTVSTLVILPLCLLRDMTPLASLSLFSVLSMVSIVVIVVYLYFANPDNEMREPGQGVYTDWFQVRFGFLECLGTFVFTFVSQHTVHLTFGSLKPSLRTCENWEKVSTASLVISCAVSLSIGVFVYMSFWQTTESDIFQIYPAVPVIDLAKILLCVTMLLTFPLPFFTCRELLIIFFYIPFARDDESGPDTLEELEPASDLEEPLLPDENEDGSNIETATSFADLSVLSAHATNLMNSALLPGEEKQLKLFYHMALTVKLWVVVTGLAIVSPSLGDVLDLVGCASGTLIAFIVPACLAFRLQGYTHTAALILVVGGVVGSVGTFYSLKKLVADSISFIN